jgi:MOSC domain-containing protein YiiM
VSAGRVEAIYVADEKAAPTRPVERVRVVAGKGIEGDRKFAPEGHARGEGRDLTLIEAEAIEGLRDDTGIEIGPGDARRNVVTRGIDLNPLVGKRVRIGEVEGVGVELCEPCRHMESLTKPGVLRGLVHRGGLRVDVDKGGEIAVGDELTVTPRFR